MTAPGVPEVVIDGIRYAPVTGEDGKPPTIGVGITTRDRRDTFNKTLGEIKRLTTGAKIVVVDDASKTPVPEATYRFEKNAGIARAKNKCLELLSTSGCEHLFLFDDDAYPLVEDWWLPYVESPEPHLMRNFLDVAGPRKIRDATVLYQDNQHIAYSTPRGVMLYVHRPVLDIAGGMDPGYGQWGYEHGDWSNRIHAFGLTTWRFADVVGSDKLIYSLDEHEQAEGVVGRADRNRLVKDNLPRYQEQYDQPIRYEYREPRDVVITQLFTARPDPQRRRRMVADVGLLADLRSSLKQHGRHLVVLHDELDTADDEATTFVRHSVGAQPYFQRWISTYQWLRAHPEVRWVWCVDGTDVRMLRDPFPHMRPGLLYLGSEHQVVGCEWMLSNHRADSLQRFFEEHHDRQLLNSGLVGGDRATVMEFLHAVVRYYHDNAADQFLKLEKHSLGVGEMSAFNRVAYERFEGRLTFGPQVNTVFKAFEKNNGTAWFAHK